jgi:hypothetical protein
MNEIVNRVAETSPEEGARVLPPLPNARTVARGQGRTGKAQPLAPAPARPPPKAAPRPIPQAASGVQDSAGVADAVGDLTQAMGSFATIAEDLEATQVFDDMCHGSGVGVKTEVETEIKTDAGIKMETGHELTPKFKAGLQAKMAVKTEVEIEASDYLDTSSSAVEHVPATTPTHPAASGVRDTADISASGVQDPADIPVPTSGVRDPADIAPMDTSSSAATATDEELKNEVQVAAMQAQVNECRRGGYRRHPADVPRYCCARKCTRRREQSHCVRHVASAHPLERPAWRRSASCAPWYVTDLPIPTCGMRRTRCGDSARAT